MKKLHSDNAFGVHSKNNISNIERSALSPKNRELKIKSLPNQKGVDDTVDLMEELLKSTQKTQKKPSTPEPVKNPARTRPAERRQSVVRKQSDDELINELLNKQERSKSKISNFEMNELFGISEKPRKDISSNLVDDLDQILSTSGAKLEPRWKLKGESPRLNPVKVNRQNNLKAATVPTMVTEPSNRRNRSQWPMELNEKRTLDLTASSKENALKLDSSTKLTPRDHYLRTTRYLPGTVTRIQTSNNNNNNDNNPLNIPFQGSRRQSNKFNSNNSWRYRNTAPVIMNSRKPLPKRPIQAGPLPGLGRTNWAQKYR